MPTNSTSSPAQDLSGAFVYAGLALMIARVPETGAAVVGYALVVTLLFFMMPGLMLGTVRGNGVRVTATQFPALYAAGARHAEALGLKKVPDVFLLQAHVQPDGAVEGLLALAAGPELYRRVDAREFAEQVQTEGGFWVRRAELLASHPTLPKRVAAVIAAGANVPAYSPVHAEAPAWLTSA